MKKLFFIVTTLFFLLSFFPSNAQKRIKNRQKKIELKKEKEERERDRFEGMEENDMYDGPAQAEKFEFERTKDPATGKIPRERLLPALEKTLQMQRNNQNANFTQVVLNWIERGPVSDSTGPSNGNARANDAVTSGRIRAVCVDSADVTRKTVWVAGTTGGIWKTTDITVSPANWTLVNDFMVNLSVTAICQNPANPNIMYACTGEAAFSSDLVRGVGVFKSTDHGVTWNLLPSTGTFTSCTRILCDPAGNVYLATRNTGLQRSLDGGSTWTDITPAAAPNSDICDMKLSQTGRLHMATGMQSTQSYFYTDIPTTATSAAGWNAPVTPFPSFNNRVEIAVSGNTLYALPANNTQFVPIIYTSTNGGATWAACGTSPAGGLMGTSGQGFWDLEVGINPANSNQCIVGGLDAWKTIDGGATWTKISAWVGLAGQYVHADQHNVTWYDGGNKLIFATDGGIHYSSDGGTTIRDRNIGLRIKQFYSVAVHPTTTNYFIGGAQDNGAHQFSVTGLGASQEYHGGDGGFVAIDQLQPLFQFSSYTYNDYYRSTDGGATWSNLVFNNKGQFINAWDYDNTAKIIYAANDPGQYLRWNDPQTGNSTSTMTIPAFGTAKVTTVFVSPYTANRVYFGLDNSKIFRVDAANGASPVATDITGASMPAGRPSSIITGTDDNHLMVIFSNYGITNIWVSTDGGTTWTGSDNNLPDMPVRWGMFFPGNNTKTYIATETGVWETDLLSGGTTNWVSNTTFPRVRTDMIKYRPSDRTIVAATYGRGMWSTTIPNVVSSSTDYFRSITSGNWNAPATWESSSTSNFASVVSPATLTPDVSSNRTDIRSGHTVTVTTNVTTSQTFVNPGGALIVTGSTLTVNGNGLTIQSGATGTGRIGNSTGTITGTVTVERYINSDVVGRKWHLLSGIATTTAQTIRDSWQEGGGAPATANRGTWVTAPGTPAGYDGASVAYSILTHNPAGPSWVNLAATNAGSINAQRAYMVFVRGDRFAQPPPNVLQAPTVLRTTGTLNQGTQPAVTILNTNPGYTIMGNPFASPIDLENVLTTPNLDQFFYVWDASIPGNNNVGKFLLVQKTGPGVYTSTPNSTNDNSLRYIHSGQGFMLKARDGNANVVLNESHKTNLLSVVNPIVNTAGNQQIYTELLVADQGSTEYVTDAVRVWFNDTYSAGTADDILKMGNFSDNISSYREGKKWIVENRPMIVKNDTIFLSLSGTAIHNYRFKINTADFVQTNVTGFLQDTWLNTNKPLNLDGSLISVDFSVTADPASANQDRFRIVFAAAPLPSAFTSVKAAQQNSNIAVDWKVTNQGSIAKYEVEKSTDGTNFTKVNTQQAVAATDAAYNWLDVNPVLGDNYYRIRSIGIGAEVKISQMVKVIMGKGIAPSITVYPSPVVNKAMTVLFTNMDKGAYQLRLINSNGTPVLRLQLTHGGGNAVQPVTLSRSIAAGTYQLEVINPDKSRSVRTVVITN